MSLAVKLALSPLLAAQAVVTRVRMPRLPEAAGARRGRVGQGPALRLLITGDSSAAGVGVVHQRLALAGRLPGLLARRGGWQVQWQLLAQSGLSSAQTLALLQAIDVPQADIVLAVTGVNDVVEQVPSHKAVAARAALADHCRNALGALHVVFAPLPPVHQMHGLPQPLRWVAGHDARRHDRALARWAATRGDVSYVPVPLQLNRGVLASDGFHPGEPVYRQCALAMAEHILGLPALQALQPPLAKPAADTSA
jgi:lysophospholipase L1-like esterase